MVCKYTARRSSSEHTSGGQPNGSRLASCICVGIEAGAGYVWSWALTDMGRDSGS